MGYNLNRNAVWRDPMETANPFVKAGERLDDLQFAGLRILQRPGEFCFGTDAVLLSDFAQVKPGGTVVDLCCGGGIVPLLLWGRGRARRILGVEIQPAVAEMARRSVALNGLTEQIEIFELDLKNAPSQLGKGIADTVTCNPPYGKAGYSLPGENPARSIARHEILCTLADCVASAAALVREGGRAAFVHRCERVAELLSLMEAHRLTPKRLRAVQPRPGAAPILFLAEGVKGAKPGVQWLAPLLLRDENGAETEELLRIYHKL